jgi:hypothetical protein
MNKLWSFKSEVEITEQISRGVANIRGDDAPTVDTRTSTAQEKTLDASNDTKTLKMALEAFVTPKNTIFEAFATSYITTDVVTKMEIEAFSPSNDTPTLDKNTILRAFETSNDTIDEKNTATTVLETNNTKSMDEKDEEKNMAQDFEFAIFDNYGDLPVIFADFPEEILEAFKMEHKDKNLFIVCRIDSFHTIQYLYTIGRSYFETDEIIVFPKHILLFDKSFYSFSLKIKIKNDKISPVSSISISRNKDDEKKIVLQLDSLLDPSQSFSLRK